MSKNKFETLGDNIDKEFKVATARCNPLNNDKSAICNAKAEGARDIARAELQATFKPTIQNRYDANMTSAGANYTIATKQCNSLQDSEIDACKLLTKETYVRDTANARSIRNSEKLGEIKKDKTVHNDNLSDSTNAFVIDQLNNEQFNTIYHVKA